MVNACRTLTIGAVLTGALFPGGASAQAPAQTVVARVPQAPCIDGRLDDAVWQQATRIADFVRLDTYEPDSQPTEAWLATDGRFLFLAMRCHELDLKALISRVRQRDGAVNTDDSIEVFLDPGTNGDLYYHFQLNCGNVQADQVVRRRVSDRRWNAAWQSGTFSDPLLPENGWTAELALPLYLFRSRVGRGPWCVNLCRNKRTKPGAYITWARVTGGFHNPENFVAVAGLSDAPPADLFAPILHGAKVTRYRFRDGRYGYGVHGVVLNDGGRKGNVEIAVADRPVAGPGADARLELTLGPLERRRFEVPVTIDRPGRRSIRVALRDPASGASQQEIEVQTQALNPLEAYLDRNYYTTEPAALLLANVAMAAEDVRAASLRVRAQILDGRGRDLAAAEGAVESRETAFALPLGAVPEGESPVHVELRDRQEALLGTRTIILRKHAPAPAGTTEVKIDKENRALLVNGSPFFPIGICAQHTPDGWLKVYREVGFNTLIRWTGIGRNHPIEGGLASLDRFREHGLFLIETPLSFLKTDVRHRGLLNPKGMLQATEEMRDYLEAARRHAAVLAYYGLDEAPERSLEKALQAFLNVAREVDPYHPVYISGSGPSRLDRYDFADILGRHVYWCPIGASPNNTPNRVARIVKWNVEHINDPNHGPFFFIPQAEITSHSRRALTPVERRITVYLALIHGAKSVIYFVSPIRHRATAKSMKELSTEIRALAPSLLRRRVEQEIDATPAPAEGDLPIVQACVVERHEGGLLLLTANSSTAPADAAWDFSALGEGVRVSDFFSGEAVALSNGGLRERYEGYATRVYLLEGGSRKARDNVVMRVALAGPALAKAKPEPEPEAANVVADPGFEAPQGNWTVVGKGAAFVAEGRDGTQCIKVTKAEPMAAVRIQMAKPFALKPATRYRFGAWVKSDLEQGQSPASVYLSEAGWQTLPKGTRPRLSAGKPAEPTAGQWQRIVREIATPDIPGLRGELWMQVPYRTTGKIWIDNVFVQEVPAKPTEQRKNLILNSSFEDAALPGWPDSWWFGTPAPDRMAGDPGGPGQDYSMAYHGKCSLRVVNPHDFACGFPCAKYRHEFGSTSLRGGIPIQPGKTYVFSAYMRAEEEGTPVDVQVCNFVISSWAFDEGVRRRFKLTTDWKRYEVVCHYPEQGWRHSIRPDLGVVIWHRRGVNNSIWVDAVQLEEGDAATTYVP